MCNYLCLEQSVQNAGGNVHGGAVGHDLFMGCYLWRF